MAEGRVLYSDRDRVHVLRYVGDIRYPLAPAVSSFVDTLLERFAGERLVVDLSSAETIDSTNLGEIARIASLLAARNWAPAAIVAKPDDIGQVLHSMALDELFEIRKDPIAADEGEPIPAVCLSKEVALRTILDAHRRLVALSEDNRKKFGELVSQLERELSDSRT